VCRLREHHEVVLETPTDQYLGRWFSEARSHWSIKQSVPVDPSLERWKHGAVTSTEGEASIPEPTSSSRRIRKLDLTSLSQSELFEVADVMRGMIRHEDELTAQRMTAFLTVEGLLFAALSFGWSKSWVLVLILAFVGFFICLSARVTLLRGPIAVGRLEATWKSFFPNDKDLPMYQDVIAARLKVSWWDNLMWPWNAIPLALAAAWLASATLRSLIHFQFHLHALTGR
jgi:hypothetical protein